MNDESINTPEWLVTVGFCTPPGSASWPSGADGALVINGVETALVGKIALINEIFPPLNYSVDPTSHSVVKDYSSIQVINGGTLKIVDDFGTWAVIGCSGNLVVDATSSIKYIGNLDAGALIGPTISTIAPDGQVLSYTGNPSNGGQGGGSSAGGSGPSAQYKGNGGGGANGDEPGGDANFFGNTLEGGAGASSNDTENIQALGGSINSVSRDGQTGTNDTRDGGGGGGAARGNSSGGLYLRVKGAWNVQGTILLTGSDGGAAGAGGTGGL